MNNILDKISNASDIKNLNSDELNSLCSEIRNCILTKVSKVGGHLGPNLGIVELTVALHYVFNSPKDKFVWDVSHQSYAHKILTGRKEAFQIEEKYKTVTGFTSPTESEHDFFTIGHTSTSVSLASGLAKARDIKGTKENIVAIIGDGSLSGGEAFEGLDNVAEFKSNFITIVNDNEMSIAENHGGIYGNLALLRKTNGTAEMNIFKALGFKYVYIEEGNNVNVLIEELKKIKDIDEPIVVHIHTLKGNGYSYASTYKENFHWTPPFDIETGKLIGVNSKETYKKTVINHITKKIDNDNRIVVINAAVPGALDLCEFRESHPEKYFDVGIAEEHAIAFSSGLASQGMKPIAFFPSTFIQRTYDQISQDLCINNNPAVIIVEGAGLSGSDVTHLGIFDIPMMSNIPNLVYLAPTNKEEVTAMIDWALEQTDFPVAIRISSSQIKELNHKLSLKYELNKFEKVVEGEKIAIIGLGNFFSLGEEVAEELKKKGINPTLINPRFITGIDEEMLTSLLDSHNTVITLEDGLLNGGFGEKIARFFGPTNMKVFNYGANKEFTDSVPLNELYKRYHLTVDQIINDIL
ncbi:1-deoxy-D-xylulose-5-phosphate synthase [Clostridium saccharobutylicum]|uniref:1-deoxy-D-xylulose-5-phosphate synthase n=1 Tax=Clostridium saccharobutylicum DSM 13864 TaxID=1345695 RepID=U5MSZ6_CLOSA|nr:1-deoxy-D-xylulose-5-phosphate synthase [Clostridium saccharobutylicum]AGX42791.1 1-deoxy-D-xylulose-5-phosphate synthase Dxs [Clostridium saccharobutylicum DSM 13864]AQR90087.1 1-deoxy-D-xylulose-5-phosphate synthase [Clostridium saccharobutylicum]AQR99992.1 1-deoxy-D-xylulose-5-phosphate synthase [Clostridium saccharobutylicum]AQS09777.1 1-deoxy-D-xylulose-5-phosphate synthase [Clostridium saccharobutylicum]AQS13976.1 1-deoxy-D-xylulose-5-phosphate synthase [Clostridium saccharobutylicum]